MWKKFLKSLPESRKMWVFLISVILCILNVKFELVTDNQLEYLLILVSGWLVGQGIADCGAQGRANEVRRAMKKNTETDKAVIEAMGSAPLGSNTLNEDIR